MTTADKIRLYVEMLTRHLQAVREWPELHRHIKEPEPPWIESTYERYLFDKSMVQLRRDVARRF